MKQAIMTAPGAIEVRDVATPQPGPGQVLLRIRRGLAVLPKVLSIRYAAPAGEAEKPAGEGEKAAEEPKKGDEPKKDDAPKGGEAAPGASSDKK